MNDAKTIKAQSAAYFDQCAATYDQTGDGRFASRMYGEILSRVKLLRPSRVLELGCDNGALLELLIDHHEARYFGLDLSREMIAQARARLGRGAELTVGDAEALPYGDMSFDLVVCNASFHHYPCPERAAAEMRRVLVPGGVVVLGDPTVPFPPLAALLNGMLRYGGSGDAHIWRRRELTALLQKAGLRVEHWKRLAPTRFVCNAVRPE